MTAAPSTCLSKITSASIYGLDAFKVEVEVDISQAKDKRSVVIVGLPDMAVRESKDRIFAAIKNSGFKIDDKMHCTINLAPSSLKKEGALYDLPIAIGILQSLGFTKRRADFLIVGELGLSGKTRSIKGALAIAILAKKSGKRGVILPRENVQEAAVIPGLIVVPVDNLSGCVSFLNSPDESKIFRSSGYLDIFKVDNPPVDFSDIKGQAHVKRAMEIVAAGGYNAILCGPPGVGKSMVAKALPGILPEMTIAEALEASKIHSIAGLLPKEEGLLTVRPFRSPHHTISYAGLVGGGTVPRPGEISLAHGGVLFLDELPEFSRATLEGLRQPLEDGYITISRANGSFIFPTSFICIAAMNPCPCGFLGCPGKICKDSSIQVERYRSKISGPLLDRIDMHIDVPPIRYKDLSSSREEENSSIIRERVRAARQIQSKRFGRSKTNSQMTPGEIKKYCYLDCDCNEAMRQAFDVMRISARGCGRILRVSRTIADLACSKNICREHIMEAINFRKSNIL